MVWYDSMKIKLMKSFKLRVLRYSTTLILHSEEGQI